MSTRRRASAPVIAVPIYIEESIGVYLMRYWDGEDKWVLDPVTADGCVVHPPPDGPGRLAYGG